ncbi:autophagy-related protein 27 [Abortiporus biennis]|nr:autophagy-related protein 27 [Abortiporus biennis]
MAPRTTYSLRFVSSLFLLMTLASTSAWAQDDQPFNCTVSLNEMRYDLTALAGERTVSRERGTPPTKMRDAVRFNLCEDLKKQDDVADEDQCPLETRACLTKTNIKSGKADQIISVIPLANRTRSAIELSSLSSPNKGLSLTFQGYSYPSSTTEDPVPQSFTVHVLCSTDAHDPKFVSYDGKELRVDWSAPAGCEFSAGPPGNDEPSGGESGGEKEVESVGSGIGYFFLLLFLAFVTYFALGAYYNYSTYGASGMDLIPHRDFWREVPYMLQDVVSHLCSAIRPRHTSSRGGYIAV